MSLTEAAIIVDKKFEFELAHLGDLSTFNFEKLRNELTQFKIVIDNFGSYFIANFESPFTILQIQYDPSGRFLKIIDQYWK